MTLPRDTDFQPHSAHWGACSAAWQGGRLVVKPHPGDPDPNPLLQNFPEALRHRARVARPMVRRGWFERGPGADDRRGRDEFVPMSWDRVLDLLARELARVRDAHGPRAIFGGSYGWSSAGRLHHPQILLHCFLNTSLVCSVSTVHRLSAGDSAVLCQHFTDPL